MRNAYDVLGISPAATDDQIKAAYRERARALHPDRQTGRSPEAVTAAAHEFSAVVSAWQILADSDQRRSYDAALRAATAPRLPGPTAAQTPPTSPSRPATTPGPAPPTTPVGSPTPSFRTRHPRGLFAAILAATVLLVGVVATVVVVGNRETTIAASSLGLPERVANWEAGNCVTTTGSGAKVPVPCSEPHDGIILVAASSPTDCPPEETDTFVDAPPRGWCVALDR